MQHKTPASRGLRRLALAAAAAAGLSVLPAFHGASASPLAPLVARAAGNCQLDPTNNQVKHVIYLVFDNTHYKRDAARNGAANVPSDLEQIPSLYNFLTANGTLDVNHHTPLISHTSDDIASSESGFYPGNDGVAQSANSYYYYDATGTPKRTSGFTYWTSKNTSEPGQPYNFVAPGGQNAPAPWVPFTRAGCNVGSVAMSGLVAENSADLANIFGAGTPPTTDPNQFADYIGVAVHCAQADPLCNSANGAAPDVLPNEPGGYSGYTALYGHKSLTQAYTSTGVLTPTGVITDINGNPIVNQVNSSITPGFPGFSVAPQYSLGYVAGMQEAGIPVTIAYIITPHRPLQANPYGYGFPTDTRDYGSGEAHYETQLQQFNDSFTKFFARLAADGINKSNTLFVATTDEEDHMIAETPTPATCDGVTVACTYPPAQGTVPGTTIPVTASLGELSNNYLGLLQGEQAATVTTPTSATVNSDDAPDIYLKGNPGQTDPGTRAFERATGALTVTNPISVVAGVPANEPLSQYLADQTEFKLLHMYVTGDPQRVSQFVSFDQPDYYTLGASPTCAAGQPAAIGCVLQTPGFNWNHGDVQPQITTAWLGLVGPCVVNDGVDNTVFSDHPDIRPTILGLTGLRDNSTSDGRVLSEYITPSCLPAAIKNDQSTYTSLAQAYKAINAPVGPLGSATLVSSTQALKSGTAADDSTYTAIESQLGGILSTRDNLVSQIQPILNQAASNPTYTINDTQAQSLIAQSNALLARAGVAGAAGGTGNGGGANTPELASGELLLTGAVPLALLVLYRRRRAAAARAS